MLLRIFFTNVKRYQRGYQICSFSYWHLRKCGSQVTISASYTIAVAPIIASGNLSFTITLTKHSCMKTNEDKSNAVFSCFRKSMITLVSSKSRKLNVPFFPYFLLICNTIQSAKSVFAKTAAQFLKFILQFLLANAVIKRRCGESEYSFPRRNFIRKLNGNPAVNRYFYGLFNSHIKESIA